MNFPNRLSTPSLCNNCTGCGACLCICSKGAISLEEDGLGFKKAIINEKLCVQCNACTLYCHTEIHGNTPIEADAVRHKNQVVLEESRSGGVFGAVGEYIISRGGIVYGAAILEDFTVEHIKAESIEKLKALKKSKYTQSGISKELYQDFIANAKSNRLVLFSGTGCQVARAKALLAIKKINTDNVYFMDIICHGVPTPRLWKDYLKYIENRYRSEISTAEFRDKSIGWSKHFESFTFKRFRPMSKHFLNIYTKLYYTNLFLRESCFSCEYAKIERCSDFTIGDFWGWEKISAKLNKDNKGISLVLVNSTKGLRVIKTLRNELQIVECTNKDYIQPNLQRPTPKPIGYESAHADYQELGFEGYLKKNEYITFSKIFKQEVLNILLKCRLL